MIQSDLSIRVETDSGPSEIYLNELDLIVDEFISNMSDEEISKPASFLAVLKHVYIVKFRPSASMQFNSTSILVKSSPDQIGRLWDWYCALAYRFGRTPTIAQFGLLTGVDRHTFQDWRDGVTRRASPAYCATAKKMFAEAEASLEAKAYESNSVASIFGLKASHNWREASPIGYESLPEERHDTAEEIKARHAHATLPVKPDLD